MTKAASFWLEGVQEQRRREQRGKINTWEKLKKYMRRKYVPPTYQQQLQVQFNTLTQGTKSVQEYIQKWERLFVLCKTSDDEELLVSKFIAGLRRDIRYKLMLTPNLTVHTAGIHAIEIEKHANKTIAAQSRNIKTYSTKNVNTIAAPTRNIQGSNQRTSPVSTEQPPKDIVCLKCNGRGHYKRECSNARAFTMREWDEIRQDTRPKKILVSRDGQEKEIYPPNLSDNDSTFIMGENGNRNRFEGDTEREEEEDLERILPEKEQDNLSIKRSSHTTPRSENSDQKEYTFQTKCEEQGEVGDLIIDGGSESKCVSK